MADERGDGTAELPFTIPTTDLRTEYPPSMGKVSRRELAHAGYTRFDQLGETTADALLAIHGVGPKAIAILREELAARGLGFADEPG